MTELQSFYYYLVQKLCEEKVLENTEQCTSKFYFV